MNYQQQSKRFVSQRKEFVIEEWYNQVLLSKDNHYLNIDHGQFYKDFIIIYFDLDVRYFSSQYDQQNCNNKEIKILC